MTMTITFLCPHNAAKSVAAAAMFEAGAAVRGLDVAVSTAGTAPDREVMPVVREHLAGRGLAVEAVPRPIRAEDLQSDRIVNIGCELTELAALGADAASIETWDDVPMVSDGLEPAMAAIELRVGRLLDELAEPAQ